MMICSGTNSSNLCFPTGYGTVSATFSKNKKEIKSVLILA